MARTSCRDSPAWVPPDPMTAEIVLARLFSRQPALARRFFSRAASGLALVFAAGAAGADEGQAAIDFNRDIRPILSDKCFFCHGPDASDRKADLRLDTAGGAFADLGGYAAIVPGKPAESEFYLRITDKLDPMPPEDSHKKLEAEEIALLARWIEEGGAYADAWAYVAPQQHPLPKVADADWPVNAVDRFVLAQLEGEGLTPSPDADRVTLIRRLYFDLIGLPPAPDAVDAFVQAGGDSEVVWKSLVEGLLESPHFGERLASYWFDLVRFADTVGYHGDQDHNIAPYRDYVIRSFNDNLPFDQFTREQIAGDLLPEAGTWQKVASGYNRLLQTTHEGGLQVKEYDAIYAADRVRNLSAVWMGATVGCAQCHDHKYDPYTIKDHYSLAAFFADIHDSGFSGNSLPTQRPPEMMVFSEEQEAELARIEREMAAAPEAERPALAEARAAMEKQGRRSMITVAKPPRTTRVLPRGNWQDDSGEIVTPAVPAFLGEIEVAEGKRADRLDLANWLMDPEGGVGGLTARVFANRFWYLFFGNGISPSLEDFGGQGEPPGNPELLDFLAVSFHENGWDIKRMIHLLVTSRAYRQSSLEPAALAERDPENRLFARQSRFRLPAEAIRDNALAVSGLLVRGPSMLSVKPYQPEGYYRHLNFPSRGYQAHLDDRQWRRGVYVHWQRMFLHPMLKAMDAPSREECSSRRPRSNTPTAALVLLNDPSFLEAARALAARVLGDYPGDFEAQLDQAFRLVLSRLPDAGERGVLEELHRVTRDGYRADPAAANALLAIGLAPIPDGIDPVALAAWTAVARTLLNLGETVTRN